MNLLQRVKKLELSPVFVPSCSICHGKGRYVVSYMHDGDPEPQAEGCRECGEMNHIVVRWVRMKSIEDRYLND